MNYTAEQLKEMLLEIDVNDINLQFIKPYMAVFADDMYGVASGKLGVGGKFDKITVWADAFVKDGMLSIDMLKSKFFFTDSVKMTKSSIIFDDITLYDEYGNKGSVSGELNHTYFKNFNYRINLGVNNCQVMNTTSADLPEFYGRIFATGGAVIAGNEEKVDIIVNARPDAGSYFAVPISSYSSAADNKFISFIDKDSVKEEDEDARPTSRTMETLRRREAVSAEPQSRQTFGAAYELTNKAKLLLAAIALVVVVALAIICVNTSVLSTLSTELGTLETAAETLRAQAMSIEQSIDAVQSFENVAEFAQQMGMILPA